MYDKPRAIKEQILAQDLGTSCGVHQVTNLEVSLGEYEGLLVKQME